MTFPGRFDATVDVALDIIGACIGILIYFYVNTKTIKDLTL